jgi:hypothetical protein
MNLVKYFCIEEDEIILIIISLQALQILLLVHQALLLHNVRQVRLPHHLDVVVAGGGDVLGPSYLVVLVRYYIPFPFLVLLHHRCNVVAAAAVVGDYSGIRLTAGDGMYI